MPAITSREIKNYAPSSKATEASKVAEANNTIAEAKKTLSKSSLNQSNLDAFVEITVSPQARTDEATETVKPLSDKASEPQTEQSHEQASDEPARTAPAVKMVQPAQQWRNCRKPHRI